MATQPGKSRRARLRPTADNRGEAVERIVQGLRERGVDAERKAGDDEYVRTFLERHAGGKGEFFTPNVSMFGIAFEHAMGGVLRCLEGDETGWDHVGLALNYARTGMAVDRARRQVKNLGYDMPCSLGDTPAFLWLLAVHCCAEQDVSPWSHYLYNLVSARGIDADIGDRSFNAFLWSMLGLACDRTWPSHGSGDDALEIFEPLLASARDPAAFREILPGYLDDRLSRSYEYADARATKAVPGSDFIFIRQWMAILPAELLGLQSLAKRAGVADLSLSAEHPLVQTPLMKPPRFDRLPTDAMLEQICDASARYFGQHWQPDVAVPLVARGQ